jgi:hypothetical protein
MGQLTGGRILFEIRTCKQKIADLPLRRKIFLVVNDKHSIHHVRERGYVESPVRIESIRKEINKTGLFEEIKPLIFSEDYIRKVHSSGW